MKTIESVMEKLNNKAEVPLIDLNQKLPFVDAPISGNKKSMQERTCSNCDSTNNWGSQSFCPECGFYPPTGQIYPGFQKHQDQVEEVTEKHWTQIIPRWAWITGSGAVVIIIASVLVGVQLHGTQLASTWGLAQFGLAACGVIISHVMAYFYSLHKTDEFGVFTLMFKPFKMWNYLYRNLPHGHSEFNCAIWSLTAMIAAPLFITQIEFTDITNIYAVRKKSDKGLQEAVQESMTEGEADGDLEGAMNDFADKAASNVTNLSGAKKKIKEEVESLNIETSDKPIWLETDCVVIGFMLDEANHPSQLVLAATVNGSLQYVGTAPTEKLAPEQIKEFRNRSRTLFRPRPLIPAPVNAYWLKPVIAVRVVHKDWTPSRKLVEPSVTEILADLDAQKKSEAK